MKSDMIFDLHLLCAHMTQDYSIIHFIYDNRPRLNLY
jgi:hypothetical protein